MQLIYFTLIISSFSIIFNQGFVINERYDVDAVEAADEETLVSGSGSGDGNRVHAVQSAGKLSSQSDVAHKARKLSSQSDVAEKAHKLPSQSDVDDKLRKLSSQSDVAHKAHKLPSQSDVAHKDTNQYSSQSYVAEKASALGPADGALGPADGALGPADGTLGIADGTLTSTKADSHTIPGRILADGADGRTIANNGIVGIDGGLATIAGAGGALPIAGTDQIARAGGLNVVGLAPQTATLPVAEALPATTPLLSQDGHGRALQLVGVTGNTLPVAGNTVPVARQDEVRGGLQLVSTTGGAIPAANGGVVVPGRGVAGATIGGAVVSTPTIGAAINNGGESLLENVYGDDIVSLLADTCRGCGVARRLKEKACPLKDEQKAALRLCRLATAFVKACNKNCP